MFWLLSDTMSTSEGHWEVRGRRRVVICLFTARKLINGPMLCNNTEMYRNKGSEAGLAVTININRIRFWKENQAKKDKKYQL